MILLPVVLLSMTGFLSAQDVPFKDSVQYRFGLFFHLDVRNENVDLVIPGYSPFCGSLQEATGRSWSVGGLLDATVLPWLTLEGRFGFSRAAGEMEHTGEPFPLRNEVNEVVNGRVDQVLEFEKTGIETVISGLVPLVDNVRGSIGLGAWFRLFSQETLREVAVEPSELLLLGNQREREVPLNTSLSYRPIVPLARLGVQYDLPIGAGSYLSVEPHLTLPLLDWTTSGTWQTFRFSFGGSLRFGIPGDHPDEPPIQPLDTLPQRLPVLIADVLSDPQIVTVEITEYDSTEALPLLNRVFFEENDTEIPERYHRLSIPETTLFTTETIEWSYT